MLIADCHRHKISECLALAERTGDATEREVYLAMADEFAQKARLAGVMDLGSKIPIKTGGPDLPVFLPTRA